MAELPEDRRFEILLDVLCCVMTADGKVSAFEKQNVAALMDEAGCQWTTDELGKRISRFLSRVRTMGFPDVLHWTCDDARLLFNTDQSKFLEDHLRIAEVAFSAAAFSALRSTAVTAATLVLGDMSIQGNI